MNTAAELRLWLADGIANGLRPWVAKFSGVLYDRRWVPVVEGVYGWHFRNERYLRNEENLARVAMVYSQQTGTYYGGEQKHRRVEDHELGMYQALVEARIPFEMAHDRLLDAEHVDRYRLLILPNIAALSDAQCEQLRQYVEARREFAGDVRDIPLRRARQPPARTSAWPTCSASAMAARSSGTSRTRTCGSRRETKHPVLKGLEDAGRIIGTVQRVEVKATVP